MEYDGTRYQGFQIQAGDVPTIQGELERAILRVTGQAARVAGAGRTDQGVHATGQVANFRTYWPLATDAILRALNAVLPEDIAVVSVADAPPDFHARFSAHSREYRYTILNRRARSPLKRAYALHVSSTLNVDAMASAARLLIGEKDFASFSGAVEAGTATVRRVLKTEVSQDGLNIFVDVVADAFLPHMVRNIVGTLLLVGREKLDTSGFQRILEAGSRPKIGITAPPHGLCLTRVNY